MKYWSFLVAKLAAAAAFLYALNWAIVHSFTRPEPFSMALPSHQRYYVANEPFAHELGYTFAMMFFTLVAAGVLWAVVWDQRYRCRTCVRRLRMPISIGSWTHILLGRPQTSYICPYGHGTLKVEELQITGHQEPAWEPHEDIWTELYALEETKK